MDSDDEIFFTVEHRNSISTYAPSYERETLSQRTVNSATSGCQKQDGRPLRPLRFNSLESSIVDNLLCEIYDRYHFPRRGYSIDSDTFTEYSSTSDAFLDRSGFDTERQSQRLSAEFLKGKDIDELKEMRNELQREITQTSGRLIRQLKSKDRRVAKVQKHCDIITAVLQASSLKRRIDTRIRFSLEPLPGDDAFQQWRDAMKAVARLPLGIPPEFRKKVWLALADKYIVSLRLDWEKTKKFAFNERSNPDDNKLGLQIVKDLHRTGCSGFNGQDNEEDRAVLKRVLLAYARWNKQVGYCQGFNVIAALILDVMDRKEDDALKVMIYLIDHVLPESYFANNLRALSVDMAVFRDLLGLQLPQLSKHLDYLQAAARDHTTGANYEPPLTNVFTMQWFLTLFATCLPKATALRVWDCIVLEGSEILLRTALSIWCKLQDRILQVSSADEFYTTMGTLTQEMLDCDIVDADELVKTIYTIAPFPHPQLTELREKYTYNITPFTAAMSTGQRPGKKMNIFSDDDDFDDDDFADQINCFTGFFPMQPQVSPSRNKPIGESEKSHSNSAFDMTKVSPGAYAAQPEALPTPSSAYAERMTMDIHMLKKQYKKLRERQQQAHIILTSASAKHNASKLASAPPPAPNKKSPKKQGTKDIVKMNTPFIAPSTLAPPIESPVAVNHLFIGHKSNRRNRHVAEAPRIAPIFPTSGFGFVSAQHPAESIVSTSKLSPSKINPGTDKPHDNDSVLDGVSTPIRTERSLSDCQSSDGYMSEASNNTRGSTAQTFDLESDTDTIGEKESEEVWDVANLQDVEDEKELIDWGDKENKECDQLINEINDVIDGNDNETTSVCPDKEVPAPDSNSNYDLRSEEFVQDTNSSPEEKSQKTSDDVSNTAKEEVNDQEESPVKVLENGSSNANNNNAVEKTTTETMDQESTSTCKHEKPVIPTDTSYHPPSPNSFSSNVTADLKSPELKNEDDAKNTHDTPIQLQVDVTNVPNDKSPTHSFHGNLESYLNSKQSITSGKTSPSATKSFSPFQNRPMINERRAQNGIRLGLYSPEDISHQNSKKISGNCDRVVSSIGRAQINACLHRQYMVEVKQQAKNRKH